ncbi:CDP-glycerol glycerophosphotransferase family protein [Virgibacillus soli]|uniref:CDP-glycerol glycerophosphotransferase family protein n=1 Tax=Paracerasibacillus soli TaxID=480284 RepID=UPI0035EB6422
MYTVKEIDKLTDEQVVILKTSQISVDFTDTHSTRIILNFEPRHVIDWLRSIYHLATSRTIFIDNYYGFLAATNFKKNVRCIQLWHAAGAIKQFGLHDPSIKKRSSRALTRFQKVYSHFDHVVVGSDKMAEIFQDSFGLPAERMLRTGVPRTDFFFDEENINKVVRTMQNDFPIIKEKKVILYAPTFRDDELDEVKIALQVDMLYRTLRQHYVLFIKLHPAINGHFQNKYPGFSYNVSEKYSINHLLTVTDILITDYSSIPFEFAFLQKPMIFFAYDLEKYAETRGFWQKYETLVPGPVVHTTTDIIRVIQENTFDMERIRAFAEDWNKYSKGNASELLVKSIYNLEQPLYNPQQ